MLKKPQLMLQAQLPKALRTTSHLCMLQLIPSLDKSCLSLEVEDKPNTPPVLQHLLATYEDLCQEPATLPAFIGPLDHKIPLKEGTFPINLRPYRYPLMH